ncbi:hypothetical protein C8R43DRAFT_577252 [Mycena crocata]|nr:hypothetical protein C8R43DRAFT_577252 [Mycena crocata]
MLPVFIAGWMYYMHAVHACLDSLHIFTHTITSSQLQPLTTSKFSLTLQNHPTSYYTYAITMYLKSPQNKC